MHADREGGIFYVCEAEMGFVGEAEVSSSPSIESAAVPVDPFPAELVFHSRPGAPNVLVLNFAGEVVSGTAWNDEVGRTEIPAKAFSTDSDYSTYSDSEQTVIRRVWQRVAEDFAPFDVDVTTERPEVLNNQTAVALITGKTDVNGDPNPFNNAGGVAYVNVFGTFNYGTYRPAWIYHDNLSNVEAYIAEAASHEIGHNLGLSHDGKTDGAEYYGGHGSGDISWGPLMGTGYGRNVSHWCKGEYYLGNNTQDDLGTIAGKVSYRSDDHGGTAGTATALVLTGGSNIVSTTPETDPGNADPANKGVLERNTDVDVFSFVTGTGPVRLSVNPWIMPAGTRGGNVDIGLELYSDSGVLLQTNNPASQTTALIQTDLPEGRYYLHVRNAGAGDPFHSTPTGYTVYGSIGQYFISGYVTETSSFIVPPLAELWISDLSQSGQSENAFTVTYSDDVAVDVSTLDGYDIRITGPNGYDQLARFVSVDVESDGTPRTATYAADPPVGEVWTTADNGDYAVWMQAAEVGDLEGAWVAEGQLGQFNVAVPVVIYSVDMDADPGWTLEPEWEYGPPSYSSSGPAGGYTGTSIVGYNLSDNYAKNLSARYATTPPIDTSGSSSLTLRFQRWLRLMSGDAAFIQASADGSSWVDVWTTSDAVSDAAWREVQYTVPAGIAGSSAVRLRWAIASNPSREDIGWNLDDVELLSDGMLDTAPPAAMLSVSDLMAGGSPSHACTVTYTDDTAVRLSSLDSTDLLVTGPNGYSNLAEFVGADLPDDGSPITGTYSIPAPGGTWDDADNGIYTVTLTTDAVEDTLNNATPQSSLGSFNVSISPPSPGQLEVTPSGGLSASGTVGGPFSPSFIEYTLSNAGESSLSWTASHTETWLSLSSAGGDLAPGASTTVTVSIHANADDLSAGAYSDLVGFVNATTGAGNATRGVTLAVLTPGALHVTPSGGLSASGTVGGPFSPSFIEYTLSNAGESSLSWTASHTETWVSLSSAGGDLAPGASTTVTVTINAGAEALSAATYGDTVRFDGHSEGTDSHLRPVTLHVGEPLAITICAPSEIGTFEMVVQGLAGLEVVIEAGEDLTQWTGISTNRVASDGTVTFVDPAAAELPIRFYRARAQSAP